MGTTISRTGRALALLLFLAVPAAATPSFALEISFAGTDEIAVGETLQCYVYQPTVHRDPRAEAMPLRIPFAWRIVPKDAATVDGQGRLKALKPGKITVHVDDAREIPKGKLPAGLPGQRNLTISKPADMDGVRLPRVDGPADLDWFEFGWRQDYDWKQRKFAGKPFLHLSIWTKQWTLRVGTAFTDPGPLPWTIKRVAKRSHFSDDGYVDLIHPDMEKRWQENLVGATLTIRSYKQGVARGSLTFKTLRGVNEKDMQFVARIPDPKGALAKAAAAKKAPKKK